MKNDFVAVVNIVSQRGTVDEELNDIVAIMTNGKIQEVKRYEPINKLLHLVPFPDMNFSDSTLCGYTISEPNESFGCYGHSYNNDTLVDFLGEISCDENMQICEYCFSKVSNRNSRD